MTTKAPRPPRSKAKVLTSAQRAYRKWYATHREEYNRFRADKYANNPEFRAAVAATQRRHREANPRVAPDRSFRKSRKGDLIEVFRVGKVSEMIGRSIEALRSWEKKKWIPKPTIEGGQRFYTLNQVELMTELVAASDEVRYDRARRAEVIKQVVSKVKTNWSKGT